MHEMGSTPRSPFAMAAATRYRSDHLMISGTALGGVAGLRPAALVRSTGLPAMQMRRR